MFRVTGKPDNRPDMNKTLAGYAYRLLAKRGYTTAELTRKLLAEGAPEEVAALVTRLEENGCLDDAAYAREYIRQRISRKPAGVHYLKAKLRARGVAPEIIAEALTGEVDPETEDAMAEKAAREKAVRLSDLPGAKRRQRLLQFLAGRGFPAALARKYAEKYG